MMMMVVARKLAMGRLAVVGPVMTMRQMMVKQQRTMRALIHTMVRKVVVWMKWAVVRSKLIKVRKMAAVRKMMMVMTIRMTGAGLDHQPV